MEKKKKPTFVWHGRPIKKCTKKPSQVKRKRINRLEMDELPRWLRNVARYENADIGLVMPGRVILAVARILKVYKDDAGVWLECAPMGTGDIGCYEYPEGYEVIGETSTPLQYRREYRRPIYVVNASQIVFVMPLLIFDPVENDEYWGVSD